MSKNTVYKTADIVRNLSIHDPSETQIDEWRKRNSDSLRLSRLYGSGIKNVKRIKKLRKITVKRSEEEYEPSEISLSSCHKKLQDSFELFEIGVTALEHVIGAFYHHM